VNSNKQNGAGALSDEQIATLRTRYGITSNGRGIREFTQVADFARAVLALSSPEPAGAVADFSDDFVEHSHPQYGSGYFCTPDVFVRISALAAPASALPAHNQPNQEQQCTPTSSDGTTLSNACAGIGGAQSSDTTSIATQTRDAWRGGDSYEASMLRNLLARIHRDGGHYIEQHGLDKALEDAEAQVAVWLSALPAREMEAETFLRQMASTPGTVIRSSRDLDPAAITEARASSRWIALRDGLGFAIMIEHARQEKEDCAPSRCAKCFSPDECLRRGCAAPTSRELESGEMGGGRG